MGKWEMVPFDEVFSDETKNGTKIMKESYLPIGKYAIIDQGKEQIAGYSDELKGLYRNIPAIIFGDHTRIIKYVDTPFFLGADGVKLLRSKKKDVDYKYLYYCLSNAHIPDTGYNRHYKWLKELHIPLPPLPVQQQIADALDRASTLIEKRKVQIEKLDLLVKSQFIQMFGDPVTNPKGWELDPLGKHLKVVGGYAFKSIGYQEEGIPVLRIGNINTGVLTLNNMVYWDYDISLDRYLMYSGDLVMSLTGTVGKDDYGNVCILSEEYTRYYLNQRNAKLDVFGRLANCYLLYLFRNKEIKGKLTGISRGIRQANISNLDIMNLSAPIPPLSLQNQFADFVHTVEAQKSLLQQSLAKMEVNYKSLMQKCFRGEIF